MTEYGSLKFSEPESGLANNFAVGLMNAGRGDHPFDSDQHFHVTETLVLISYCEELKTARYPLYHTSGGGRSHCTQLPHPAPRIKAGKSSQTVRADG